MKDRDAKIFRSRSEINKVSLELKALNEGWFLYFVACTDMKSQSVICEKVQIGTKYSLETPSEENSTYQIISVLNFN